MKNVINGIFVGLGVIFLIFIFLALYMFIADPYNLKPLITGIPAPMETTKTYTIETPTTDITVITETATTSSQNGFQLSSAQKQALVSFGIDPATVPSTVSASQETCFVSVLGEARVGQIKAGAVPNAIEFLRAKACI